MDIRGAEEHYTRSNNKTRSEGIEEAIANDIKVLNSVLQNTILMREATSTDYYVLPSVSMHVQYYSLLAERLFLLLRALVVL